MEYDWPVFRPPSEAESLIIQATLGCSANTCKFCYMYKTKKFRIRPLEEVLNDLKECAITEPHTQRIFLADGDALVIPTEQLLKILNACYKFFPKLERVTGYANPKNLLEKTVEELKAIQETGLSMIYYGIESGDEELLKKIKKQATTEQMIEGCKKAHQAGLVISLTVILGLAGKKGSQKHAEETASLLNQINPRYISALTLMLGPFEKNYKKAMGADFEFLNKLDFLRELKGMVQALKVKDSIFRTNHASNYLPIKGNLPEDKDKILTQIEYALTHPQLLRPEEWRAL